MWLLVESALSGPSWNQSRVWDVHCLVCQFADLHVLELDMQQICQSRCLRSRAGRLKPCAMALASLRMPSSLWSWHVVAVLVRQCLPELVTRTEVLGMARKQDIL